MFIIYPHYRDIFAEDFGPKPKGSETETQSMASNQTQISNS